MRKNIIKAFVVSLLVTEILAGCGGHEVVRPTVSVSIGQQLIDLKQAHDNGALSRPEYERQRQQLIDSVE